MLSYEVNYVLKLFVIYCEIIKNNVLVFKLIYNYFNTILFYDLNFLKLNFT